VTVDPWIAEAEIAPDARAAIPPMLAAERREPDAIAVHYVLGSVYYNAGRKRAALHEFQRALQLHPGDDAVTRALAVVRQSLKK
jgi:Tfp pilus assembly protein PilF